MVVPKSIVITTLANKILAKPASFGSSIITSPSENMTWELTSQLESSDEGTAPVRKRQRLDHLSSEEKLMRRKLKNRVAAQSARDRKKARMQDLEDQVSVLQAERNKLLAENAVLKKRIAEYEEENNELKSRLSQSEISVKGEDAVCPAKCVKSSGSLEYASLVNDPLQKDQVPLLTLSLWMMQYGFLQLMTSVMISLICFKNVEKVYSGVICPQKPRIPDKISNRLLPNLTPVNVWWGPQQRNWNPSKN